MYNSSFTYIFLLFCIFVFFVLCISFVCRPAVLLDPVGSQLRHETLGIHFPTFEYNLLTVSTQAIGMQRLITYHTALFSVIVFVFVPVCIF